MSPELKALWDRHGECLDMVNTILEDAGNESIPFDEYTEYVFGICKINEIMDEMKELLSRIELMANIENKKKDE